MGYRFWTMMDAVHDAMWKVTKIVAMGTAVIGMVVGMGWVLWRLVTL